jgi:lauroyl/myristoyl acyltransferase
MLAGMRKEREVVGALSSTLSIFLGEPVKESRRLAREWLYHYVKNQKRFELAARESIAQARQRAEEIQMIDEIAVANFVNRIDTGVVLSTIHMGDYLHAMFKLFGALEPREVIVLRREAWSSAEQTIQKIENFGHRVTPVIANATAARTLLRNLRRGAIAVLLYDLPQRWGATAPVRVLNHPMQWVCGPTQLAMMARSCVLPFYCFEHEGKSSCEFGELHDYRKMARSNREIIEHETQILASAAETYIRQFVTQWENWRLVEEMLVQGQEGLPDG